MAESGTASVLSNKLKSFENIYSEDGGYHGMVRSQSDVTSALQTTYNNLNSIIDDYGRAGNDNQITTIKNWIKLANSGIDILKRTTDNDLDCVFDNGKKLHGYINEYVAGENDQAKRDHYTAQCERYLQELSEAINAVKLGIRGNMHKDGSLGNYVPFDQGFKFEMVPFNSQNATTGKLNFLQNLGCFVIGGVEGFCKVFEGIGDFLLTGVSAVCQGVGSCFGWNKVAAFGKSVENFAKKDLSHMGATWVASKIGVSKEVYEKSLATKIGNITGSIVGFAVLSAVTATSAATAAGKILVAESIGGNVAESSLQKGRSAVKSFLFGAAAGAASIAVSLGVEKVATKVSAWLTNPANSNNLIVKGWNAATTSMKNFNATSHSMKAKIVNAVTSPLRGLYKVMNGATHIGDKTIGKIIGKTLTGKSAAGIQKFLKLGSSTSLASLGYGAASRTLEGAALTAENAIGRKV